jgi:Response regulator containing a CheY-like receiver domain and an HTH DNA-binding domain
MNETKLNSIKFLLADDHNIVRQGMQIIIEDLIEDSDIYHASSMQQVLEQVKLRPLDIIVLDAQFPDGNCLSLIPEIKRLQSEVKILIFSSFDEENYSLKFIKAGADGFLSKLSEEQEIRQAIIQIIEKGKYYPVITQKLLELSVHNPALLNPLSQLSERELQIAELYSKGYGNLEIANHLSLRQNTVSTFKKRIFEKLNVENLADLIELMKTHSGF